MQTWIFLGQLSFLWIHRIIVKRRGPAPDNPGQGQQEERRFRRPRPQLPDRSARHERLRERKKEDVNGAVGGPEVPNDREGAIGGPKVDAGPSTQANGIKPKQENNKAPARSSVIEVVQEDADDEKTKEGIRRRNNNAEIIKEAGPRRGPRIARKLKPKDKKEYNKIIFLPCALCDFAKTGLLFIGIKQTYPSSFIMLQGVGLLSTCMLTVAFVGREKTVKKLQWVGASITAVGMAVTGIRDYVWGEDHTYDPYGIAAGDLLIVMAQLMTAIQVILEQRFVKKHDIDPLVAVGLEGMFGSGLLLILLIPFYFVDVGAFNTLPKHRLEDPYDAFRQMQNCPELIAAFLGSVLFLPLFYYFGISITKNLDAVHRMGVQANVKILAWVVYLIVGWQAFHPIEILGFALSIAGVIVFFLNEILERVRAWRDGYQQLAGNDEEEPLINPDNPGIQDYGAQEHRPRQMNKPC